MLIKKKNVCESALGTIMNIEGKTKDSLKAQLNLENMDIMDIMDNLLMRIRPNPHNR